MGKREVIVSQAAAFAIAQAAMFVESKVLSLTAVKFSDSVYQFLEKISGGSISYPICREPKRANLGLRCVTFKKYTIVFLEFKNDIVVCEFIPSKMLVW
jgi:hypothetical protein